MPSQPNQIAVLLDFDGTITTRDVGDLVIEGFGRDGWQAASAAYDRGEISLRELWAAEISYLRQDDHEAIRKMAAEVAEVRPGFTEFIDYCARNHVTLEVASSGIRFYIDAVLEKSGVETIPVAAPDIEYDSEGKGLVTFLDGISDCGMTAMCKCERVWRQRRLGKQVLFVGDGASDYCAALQADYVMARDALARYCQREGREFTVFEDFFEVSAFVERLTSGLLHVDH